MPEFFEGNGRCLCGAVTVTAANAATHVGACHCHMCQRWGGGPLLAVEGGREVHFDGMESIAVFDSSEWAERGFCSRCGTHLFYRIKATGEYMLPAGLLDDQSGLKLTSQIFIDRKPGYYAFENDTKNLTEAQIFEMYGDS